MQLSSTKASSEWLLLYQQHRWYKGKSVYSFPDAKHRPFSSWRDWTARSRNYSFDQASVLLKKIKTRKKPKTYTLTPTSFSFSTLILPLTSLSNSGAFKTITIHILFKSQFLFFYTLVFSFRLFFLMTLKKKIDFTSPRMPRHTTIIPVILIVS